MNIFTSGLAIVQSCAKVVKEMKRGIIIIFSVQGIVLLLALGLGIQRDNPDKHFGEAGFITTFSFLFLIFISYVFAIVFYNVMRYFKASGYSPFRSFRRALLFLVLAIGFLWLSFDEIMMIHENIGKGFHQVFQIEETSLTSRIDDFVVMMYPIIGLIAIYLSRQTLVVYKKASYFVIMGIMVFCVMAVYDSLGKGMGSRQHDTRTLYQIMEESSKVLAEGFFAVSALYCLKVSEGKRQESFAKRSDVRKDIRKKKNLNK